MFSGQLLNACNPDLEKETSFIEGWKKTLRKEAELATALKKESEPEFNKVTAALKKGLEEHKFDEFIAALKTGTLIKIAGTDYLVCQELPKLYSRTHEEEVPTNPCYPESSGIGPKLLTPARLEYLPADDPFVSFYLCGLITSPDADYITLSFTTDYNPHWQSVFSSPVPMDKRYWSEDHTASWVPLRYVSFLLHKRS
jgi:hypothetical protein